MGWLYYKNSKDELVKDLLDPAKYSSATITDHSLRGNHLWIQIEKKDTKERLIGLFLLGSSGRTFQNWGYKDMDETMHPYFYDCPMRLIDTATEPLNELAAEWRKKVRTYWERKKSAPKPICGMTVNYGGNQYKLEKNLGRKGWEVLRVIDGQPFRMKSRQVTQALNA